MASLFKITYLSVFNNWWGLSLPCLSFVALVGVKLGRFVLIDQGIALTIGLAGAYVHVKWL